jgi:L-alanine-DL-glutamate epimerase-like enolase superfamily enzyme
MNRREYLSAAAGAVAGAALLDNIAAGQNPAAGVADKTSTIKLTGMRTYWSGPAVYVRLETNHGVVGWGEIKAVDPRVARVLVESLYELIDGENPTRIEYLWQKIYRAHRDIRVNAIKVAREKVGPDGAVMFDAHCAVPPAALMQLASAIKAYDLLFLEEPAVPGNIEVFKRLKQAIPIPFAAGERDRTIWEFIPYLHERCLDILQPDCCHGGGITAMKKVAVLAEAYHVPIAPHCTASYIGIAASLHVAASVPFFLIHEFYPDNQGFNPKGTLQMAWQLDKEGYIGLPPGPGLGVEVDEKLLEESAKKPQKYKWPGAKLRDGSIADY